MKITFKENNAALTYETNGDININPKLIIEFGHIEGTDLNIGGFIFDCNNNKIGINIIETELMKKIMSKTSAINFFFHKIMLKRSILVMVIRRY